ncbi:CBF/Mak21 family-domain-containing protein [Catenaria anguillulae PL171]|uniref:CBF/Mak21 family-domain-containing protein n=1 Tax=Catenaria anguillulae PL171 TaxID=765915 RepID=A0A1Y2HZ83_9FUNG|nr:CBF/Mak21 family-domain-containing protein [Catenaria anguillulae PL171]
MPRPPNNKPGVPAAKPRKPVAPASATNRYLITPHPVWHEIDPETQPGRKSHSSAAGTAASTADGARRDVNGMLLRGTDLLKDEGKRFSSDKSRTGGDAAFMRTILSGGTLSDRVSALTLLVQSSPVHNMLALEQLFNLAKKKNRRMVTLVVDALKDLLTGGGLSSGGVGAAGLLPSDRKLQYFVDLVANIPRPSDAQLVMFAFEDRLKRLVFEFLGSLEQLSHDPLTYIRSKATSVFLDMLAAKPEQEANLLKLLVNKLGDQDRKLAAKASFLLHQLTTEHHPAMKLVVVKAIEEFMHRPHVGARAHYYAVITLNQLMLSHDEVAVARYLVDVYFGFFNKLANESRSNSAGDSSNNNKKDKKAESIASPIDHKILSGLLTGVNRAFPYAKDALIAEDLQAAQNSDKIQVTTDKKKAKAALASATPTSGSAPSALTTHLTSLFKITHHPFFPVRVQALSLIFQVVQSKPDMLGRYYRSLYSTLLDARHLVSAKQLSLFLNLVYRSIKADANIDRVQAFLKRVLQLAAHDRHAGFAIGALWMVALLMQQRQGAQATAVWNMINLAEDEAPLGKAYDPMHRTPEFAHAGTACMWELVALANHFHPSVQVFAAALLAGKPLAMPEGVDPLDTFTLAKFLDKFVYKKPKKNSGKKGGRGDAGGKSVVAGAMGGRTSFLPEEDAEAAAGKAGGAKGKVTKIKIGSVGTLMNSEGFVKKHVSEVAADELFFHQFFTKQSQLRPKKHASAEQKALEDAFDIANDGDDAWNPDAAGSDEDVNESDLEEGDADAGSDMDEDEIERAIRASSGFSKSHLPDDADDEDMDDDELEALKAGMAEASDDEDEGGEGWVMDEDVGQEHAGGEDDEEDMIDLEAAFADAAGMSDDEQGEGDVDAKVNFDDEQDGYDSDEETMSRRKKKKQDKAKLGYSLSGSVFASAEEFSRMIESTEGLDEEGDDEAFGDVVMASETGAKGKKRKRNAPGGVSPGGKKGGRPQKRRRR